MGKQFITLTLWLALAGAAGATEAPGPTAAEATNRAATALGETNRVATAVGETNRAATAAWSDTESTAVVGATVVTSKRLTFDYARMIARFERNVRVRDPRYTLYAKKLTVLFTSTNTVKSVTALGNVRMTQADKRATCNKAVYLARSGDVILSGEATVSRERDIVRGDVITFNLYSEKMTSTPGHLQIYPDEGSGGGLFDPP
jgi:lipopolysaccharide transport protein LptA